MSSRSSNEGVGQVCGCPGMMHTGCSRFVHYLGSETDLLTLQTGNRASRQNHSSHPWQKVMARFYFSTPEPAPAFVDRSAESEQRRLLMVIGLLVEAAAWPRPEQVQKKEQA